MQNRLIQKKKEATLSIVRLYALNYRPIRGIQLSGCKVLQQYYLLLHFLFSTFLSNFLTHPEPSLTASFHDMHICSHLAVRFPVGLSQYVLVKFPMGYARDDYSESKTL
jgi:hypothetical protein